MYYDKRTETEPVVSPAKPVPYPEPWQQSLLEAAQCLRNKGWCQHATMDGHGRHCLTGALQTIHTIYVNSEEFRAVKSLVGMDPVEWNDKWGRTKEEVIAVLEKATGL